MHNAAEMCRIIAEWQTHTTARCATEEETTLDNESQGWCVLTDHATIKKTTPKSGVQGYIAIRQLATQCYIGRGCQTTHKLTDNAGKLVTNDIAWLQLEETACDQETNFYCGCSLLHYDIFTTDAIMWRRQSRLIYVVADHDVKAKRLPSFEAHNNTTGLRVCAYALTIYKYWHAVE